MLLNNDVDPQGALIVENKILLAKEDAASFRAWAELDMESLTWQGQFLNEFSEFWSLVFAPGLDAREVMDGINALKAGVQTGPLASWFDWLGGKFVVWLFIHKNVSILGLARTLDLPVPEVAFVLRNFFVEKYSHLEDKFAGIFQIGNVASPHLEITSEAIYRKFSIPFAIGGGVPSDMMAKLEVTLYDEWKRILVSLREKRGHGNVKAKSGINGSSWKTNTRFIGKVVGLLLSAFLIIWAVKETNRWYELYLSGQITLFDPVESSFIEEEAAPGVEFSTTEEVKASQENSRPKEIPKATLASTYEEKKKETASDRILGNRIYFRVMLKSPDTNSAKEAIDKLVIDYKAEPSDRVLPGTEIPGGVYYNLHVPKESLKEFLEKVTAVGKAKVYQTKTRTVAPAGKEKVFIWIKDI
jgi:hypothetical protein